MTSWSQGNNFIVASGLPFCFVQFIQSVRLSPTHNAFDHAYLFCIAK
jgi:hypothetical protein